MVIILQTTDLRTIDSYKFLVGKYEKRFSLIELSSELPWLTSNFKYLSLFPSTCRYIYSSSKWEHSTAKKDYVKMNSKIDKLNTVKGLNPGVISKVG